MKERNICKNPTKMEVRVIATQQNAFLTGQNFSPNVLPWGFACQNN